MLEIAILWSGASLLYLHVTHFLRLSTRSGDMLFIPSKHWHYVRSLSPSFSVNFWF